MSLLPFGRDPFFDWALRTVDPVGWPDWRSTPAHRSWPTDIEERKDAYLLHMDVPGFDKDQISVSSTGNTLLLKAEQKTDVEKSEADGRIVQRERTARTLQRSFQIPDDVAVDNIECCMDKGVLTVKLPRREGTAEEPRQIQIRPGKM